ncbi:DEAD/DEAH box helicase [Treponema denticola]|uniref:DEAD/DEAH box helicase n=1 Tax=Treponema denticola TaxID=158 RepID=UPI0020A302CC|nr:ATP-binding protein [Treponema denticola]UTC82220.1 AAA family ATPase [Treponema denticola]
MELKDVNIQDSLKITCKVLYGAKLPNGVGEIIRTETSYIFKGVELSISDEGLKRDLDFYLTRGTAHLAEVETMYKDNTIVLNCCFFADRLISLDKPLHIYIHTDKINSKKTKENKEKLDKYFKDVTEKCHIISEYKDQKDTYFIIQANPEIFVPTSEIHDEIKKEQDEKIEDANDLQNQKNESEKRTPEEKNKQKELKNKIRSKIENADKQKIAFAIYGTNIRIDAEKWQNGNGFSAKRLVTKKSQSSAPNYLLIKGSLVFSNEKTAVSNFIKAQLENIKQKGCSYLDAWDKYSQERGENLLEDARNFGTFSIQNIEKIPEEADSYKLFLNHFDEKKIIHRMTIDIVEEEPLFFRKKDLSWNDYLIQKEEENKNKEKVKDRKEKKIQNLEIQESDNYSITVRSKFNLLKLKGEKRFICFSTLGEEIQLERQKSAREAISEGKSGIPYLAMLLEEQGKIPHAQKNKTYNFKLSLKTYDKVFKKPPTDTQRNAIKLAMQTPDIALIQGPPGTGKTTVITAIVEELKNAFNKENPTTGAVLLSSYQHASVENIIERVCINSLPTPKFGKKQDSEEYNEHIEKWINDLIESVRKENPRLERLSYELELDAAYAEYEKTPSPSNKIKLLDKMLHITSLSDKLRAEITKERDGDNISDLLQYDIVSKIRALRITSESFCDDGRERCKDLLYELKDEGDNEILKRYAYLDVMPDNASLKDLRSLKEKLLIQALPRPSYAVFTAEPNIQELYGCVKKEIRKNRSKKDKTNLCQYEYLEHLESNPIGIENAIKDCSFAISATAQQSEGTDIIKFKNDFQLYDTVIIDEAARATPPDLLIPMAKARKKIILIGDHRQLPHLIDEELEQKIIEKEKEAESEKNTDLEEYYNLSLFEHLFTRLKELEQTDGIKRIITLDAQYRMHPLLGQFASDNFYKKHKEEFKSPRPAEEFIHNLPKTENKACIWLDVPKHLGFETRAGTSIKRKAEITAIINYLEKWKNSEEGKNLTYGIITFYKAQSDAIKQALKDKKIKDIRVGTVDAFQGMEFDIVFLSAVRCNNKKNYGFLTMENRLNVAVTRQKKALIFVGDSEFLTSSDARLETNISAVGNFYDLCKQDGIILQGDK